MNNLIDNAAKEMVKDYLDHLQTPHEPEMSAARKQELREQIKQELKARDAVLVAHYYTSHDLQALAEETGGYAANPQASESPVLIRAQLCAVLVESVRQMLNPPTAPKEFVSAAVAYLRAHLQDTVRMSDLVRHVGFSRARLFDIFKAQTGLTPNHYLQRLRIERAQAQLTQTKLSITEIAHATGFSSGQYFSTVFGRYTGLSPSNFRKASRRGK